MQRKQNFPVANCNIKMPDNMPIVDGFLEEEEPIQRRQQLVNFGHAQWGFNNWSWSVTKQELDFVEMSNGKYTAGVVAFVSVNVKTVDIHRENIGYATSLAPNKGSAIHRARKCAVTNALRETLLSFGGSVGSELAEQLELRPEPAAPEPADNAQNNQNCANAPGRPPEPRNSPKPAARKEPAPCARNALPLPANLPPAARAPARAPPAPAPAPPPAPRPPSTELKLDGLTEEEARAERKRRQRLAQEEFRLKHLMKQKDTDDVQDMNKNSSIEMLLVGMTSQDILIEDTGNTVDRKRKSPTPGGGNTKCRGVLNRLDIIDK